MNWIVGLDYSMTCPAITVAKSDSPFSFESCQFYYLSERQVNKGLPNVTASRLPDYDTNEQRFDVISSWAIGCIQEHLAPGDGATAFIEDYSYGSKGKVFHIAENTGLVKHKLWKLGLPITAIAPTVIKRFATTKGNADKDKMYAAFLKDTGVDLMPIYQPKAKAVGSPVGDVVDSFYICKYGWTESNK
jgi:hypothetical protein